MELELFVDTIGRADLAAGVVRIDLVAMRPADGGGDPQLDLRRRLVMPLDGFLSALNTLNGLAEKLAAAGLITKGGAGAKTVAAEPAAGSPKSPNFG
jgi:hypothetical protein